VPRDDASRADSPRSARILARLRALPWATLVVVALLALSAAFPLDPLRDAAGGGPITEATLHRPAGYLLLAPISNVLDTVTLLSVRQHVALIVTLVLGWIAWWWWARRASDAAVAPGRLAVRIAARLGIALVLLVGLYAAALVIPRPMAGIETVGQAIIAVDFHAHTKYSHDGRPGWTAEDVRAWHRDAGYDVAYVSDHRTFDGAREGWANNPSPAGQGTVLLPAIEVVWQGERVNVLDADRMYRGILDAALRDIDDDALRLASLVPRTEPVLIQTIPGNLAKVRPAKGPGTPGVRAIEIVDGSPRGLSQGRLERARILDIADSANIALVAGSDNHGWGRTAPAWTLLILPGWRAASPDQLSQAIAQIVRLGGRGATKVVERYVADTDRAVLLPFTVPVVTWGMFRTLSLDERVVWLAWLAAIALLWRVRGMRRRPPAE
jgi:hypothetical protein